MQAIGVGCFWFSTVSTPADEEINNFSSTEFVRHIVQALEGVDNVSNVKTHGDEDALWGSRFFDDLEEDYLLFPMYANLRLDFDIHIPLRIQRQFCSGWDIDEISEQFSISIVYDIGMPVTYIHYKVHNHTDLSSVAPSRCVRFIREYLSSKLENHPKVKFQSLGPSPFHANIIIQDAANRIELDNHEDNSPKSKGYEQMLLTYDSEPSHISLDQKFISSHHDTFDTYYELVCFRNVSMRAEVGILNGTNELFSPTYGFRFFSGVRTRIRQEKEIDTIYRRIMDEKMNRFGMNKLVNEAKRNGIIDEENPFYFAFEKLFSEESNVPLDETREVLKMFEERRQKYFSNATTVVAGILGGVLGAILGSALTFMLTAKQIYPERTSDTLSMPDTATAPVKPRN